MSSWYNCGVPAINSQHYLPVWCVCVLASEMLLDLERDQMYIIVAESDERLFLNTPHAFLAIQSMDLTMSSMDVCHFLRIT